MDFWACGAGLEKKMVQRRSDWFLYAVPFWMWDHLKYQCPASILAIEKFGTLKFALTAGVNTIFGESQLNVAWPTTLAPRNKHSPSRSQPLHDFTSLPMGFPPGCLVACRLCFWSIVYIAFCFWQCCFVTSKYEAGGGMASWKLSFCFQSMVAIRWLSLTNAAVDAILPSVRILNWDERQLCSSLVRSTLCVSHKSACDSRTSRVSRTESEPRSTKSLCFVLFIPCQPRLPLMLGLAAEVYKYLPLRNICHVDNTQASSPT